MEGQATPLGRDKRRIRRALGDESCDGGRRGRRTDGGAGLGRRGQATDAADAEGTRDGCGGGDRRRMRRGQATDGRGVGGRAAGQATCESATQGGGRRASLASCEPRRGGETAWRARRGGESVGCTSDQQWRYTAAIRRLDTAARCSGMIRQLDIAARHGVAAA